MSGTQLTILPGGRARYREPRSASPTSWSPYTAKARAKCSDCLVELGADPHRPAARLAQRRLRAKNVDVLVCYQHAASRGDSMVRPRQRAAG